MFGRALQPLVLSGRARGRDRGGLAFQHARARAPLSAISYHVHMEKPISNSVASGERLVVAAEEARRVLMVAENSQYWREVRRASAAAAYSPTAVRMLRWLIALQLSRAGSLCTG